jgi:SAM-dependent methyltransferase
MDLAERACDCCASRDLEQLWRYTKKARTKHAHYEWDVRVVICRKCGFVFVSPCPTEAVLNAYYRDSFEYWKGQALDYSIDKRIHVIARYTRGLRRAVYLEVGSNESSRFNAALARHVSEIVNVELNESCSGCRSLESLQGKEADILASYFVLEHVANPAAFLTGCARCLKPGGILIIEVPDLYGYPNDSAGLALWEHTNHFSPRTLAALAAAVGFRLLEVSHRFCSRSFGFTAVFCLEGGPQPIDVGPSEYPLARSCVLEGLELIAEYRRWLGVARRRIDEAAKAGGVVLWAANGVCADLLEGYHLPSGAVIVDSNPEKQQYFPGLRVWRPHEAAAAITGSHLLVINTKLNAPAILDSVRREFGREFTEGEVLIIEDVR